MIVIINIFKFRKWFKYGLKSKHPTAARPERAEALSQGLLWTQAARPERAEAPSPGQRPGVIMFANLSPCKGKSFIICQEF